MPFSYGIDAEQGVGILRFAGTLTGPQLVSATRTFFSDEAWEPAFSALWNARLLHRLIIEPEDTLRMRETFAERRARIGTGRTAVLTANADVDFIARLLRELSHRTTGRQVGIFHRLEEALAWLALEEVPPSLEHLMR